MNEHEWIDFPGGPPSDMYYQWCQKCGVLKVQCSGDPDEYYKPGVRYNVIGHTMNGDQVIDGPTEDPGCNSEEI